MGLVTGVLAAFVACSRPVVLILAPAFGSALDSIEFFLTCSDTALVIICLILFGLAYRLFLVHRTDMTNAAKMIFKIFLWNFKFNRVHTCIGLNRSRIYGLGMSTNHSSFYT